MIESDVGGTENEEEPPEHADIPSNDDVSIIRVIV
jgi:hypothetical protein